MFEQLRPSQYCHLQTSPLGHVRFNELQPVLQSQRNISSNLGRTGCKSVVLGISVRTQILFSLFPHSVGNILSDYGIVLQLRSVLS